MKVPVIHSEETQDGWTLPGEGYGSDTPVASVVLHGDDAEPLSVSVTFKSGNVRVFPWIEWLYLMTTDDE